MDTARPGTAGAAGAAGAEPAGYARRLAGKLAEDCGVKLAAAVLHGSAALGGWQPGRSDVDLLFVVQDVTTDMDVRRMVVSLVTLAQDCPGSAIETSIVTEAQAAMPGPPWPYLWHVVAGPGAETKIHPAPGDVAHDPDLLMHFAVCRAAGVSVYGAAPQAIFGPIARPAILAYLAGELQWGLENAPEAYAVLNACRAQVYLTDDLIVSKIAGGETVLARGTGPAAVIGRALDQQRGRLASQPPGADAARFALATAAELLTAAGPRP